MISHILTRLGALISKKKEFYYILHKRCKLFIVRVENWLIKITVLWLMKVQRKSPLPFPFFKPHGYEMKGRLPCMYCRITMLKIRIVYVLAIAMEQIAWSCLLHTLWDSWLQPKMSVIQDEKLENKLTDYSCIYK